MNLFILYQFQCLFVFFHVHIQLLFKSALEFYACDWITTPLEQQYTITKH